MNILEQCIASFEKLFSIQYHFQISKNRKITDILLEFEKTDFKHLVGLQYLRDVAMSRNSERVFEAIKSGKISFEIINNSAFYQCVKDSYANVSKRMELFPKLEKFIENDNVMLKYVKKRNPYSKIDADYVIESDLDGTTAYIFLRKKANGKYGVCSFFEKAQVVYQGENTYWIRKEKMDLKTGKKEVLFAKKTSNREAVMEKNQIFIKCGTDYKEMTKELLKESGLGALIGDREKRIGIKPNLVAPTEASYGGTTHPEVAAGIIEYLQENGFHRLHMMEGSWVGDKTSEAYEVCGFRALSEKYGVPFLDMQKDRGIVRDCGGMELRICESVEKTDFLINVPVLKGHCQTRITCALKNMKGLIPNSEKRRFHALGLHRPIAHLNAGIRQDFIVVDNICGDLDFEDGGNPVVMNRILTGRDPVLMDAYVCRMMHYPVSEVPYVGMAGELGVGCPDIQSADIRICGEDEGKQMPKSRKVVELADAVEEVESCSACYGYLIPALEMLKEDGLFEKLDTRICIGQGFRGKTGKLGIGHCTKALACHLEGCPPTETQIYEFLKDYILSL